MHKHFRTLDEAMAYAGKAFDFNTTTQTPFLPLRPYEVCVCSKTHHITHHQGDAGDVLRHSGYWTYYKILLENPVMAQKERPEDYALALRWKAEVSQEEMRHIEIKELRQRIAQLRARMAINGDDDGLLATLERESLKTLATLEAQCQNFTSPSAT